MKLRQIALAAAVVAAAPAYALTPAQAVGATQIWITGASAPTNSVFQAAMSLCRGVSYRDASRPVANVITNPGTLDVHMYLESTGLEPGKSSGDRVAYACTIETADGRAGALEGQPVVIYHTVEGGSFNAYSPALRSVGDTNAFLPTTLQRITEVSDLGAGCGTQGSGNGVATAVSISGVVNNIQRYNSCARTTVTLPTPAAPAGSVNVAGDTGPVQSAGGFSDTEYLINKLNLAVDSDLSTIGSEVNTNIGQGFGVGVSYPLYFQLQQNDIAAGNLAATCDDAPFTATAPNLTAACQPSIAAATYAAIANVSSAGGVNASLFGGSATGVVNFARRAPTSGTQSASNLRFLSAPCARGLAGGELTPTRTADSTPTLVVTEQSGTGGVKTALNAATGAGQFGLGVMSLENTPAPTATADRWAFVKLDGVSSNTDTFQRANAIAGSYNFWYELVAFTSSVAGAPAQGPDLITALNSSMQNPNLTNLKGLFLTPLSGADAAVDSNATAFTRFGNSCQPLTR
jgi:hypothetical protein